MKGDKTNALGFVRATLVVAKTRVPKKMLVDREANTSGNFEGNGINE